MKSKIKPKELRIGNLGMYANKVCEVFHIMNDSVCAHVFQNLGVYDGIDLEPIPLTEEWLLKFGFEKEEGYTPPVFRLSPNGVFPSEYMIRYFFSEYEIQLRDDIDFDMVISPQKEYKYVHTLQNLIFALSGEELNLTK